MESINYECIKMACKSIIALFERMIVKQQETYMKKNA